MSSADQIYTTKITTTAISDVMALFSTGPIIITGGDLSVRNGETSLVIHFTDSATENDRTVVIKLEQ